MKTLSRWLDRFHRMPARIECSEMRLHGFSDHEPPIFTGTGSVEIEADTSFSFSMHAQPHDPADAFRRLVECQENPYDAHKAFRLSATDYAGIDWACGWTRPGVLAAHGGSASVLLGGKLASLSAEARDGTVSADSGIELVYEPAPFVPMGNLHVTTVQRGAEVIGFRQASGHHSLEVLGSLIEISRDPWSGHLWLVANTSEALRHPCFENWASEPLRVLCGQLIYPRFVARNFGDGRAAVWLRRTPPLESSIDGYAAAMTCDDAAGFWTFYGEYLTFLARSRGPDGLPHIESNPVTRFHEEVIQAAHGSKWIFSLSIASAIEGLCRMAAGASGLPREFTEEAVAALKKQLEGWNANGGIRRRALTFADNLNKPSVGAYLEKLVGGSAITSEDRDAWLFVRNRVMHGNLSDPWPEEKADARLECLLMLFYKLTRRVVGASSRA